MTRARRIVETERPGKLAPAGDPVELLAGIEACEFLLPGRVAEPGEIPFI